MTVRALALAAAGGNDLLIGGLGRDQIDGNQGNDLLIGGTTAYDDREEALRAISAEWTSPRDYATRVANLHGSGTGPRLNEEFFLKFGETVFDDLMVDGLSGQKELDWFFVHPKDRPADRQSSEVVN